MANRVLVVDDEMSIRTFLVRVLQLNGYDVDSASNGQEALVRLESNSFDVLLTDIRMEQVDGVALLKTAKERYPDLAVILLTGHATVPTAVAALRQGAHDYLLKPIRNEDILSAVASAVESRARQQRRDRLEQIAVQLAGVVRSDVQLVRTPDQARLSYGPLTLDIGAFRASLAGYPLDLTLTEFRLLLELARSPEQALGYVALVQAACGYVCSRQEAREIISAHVLNLRKKLRAQSDANLLIESVRSIGYRLVSAPGL